MIAQLVLAAALGQVGIQVAQGTPTRAPTATARPARTATPAPACAGDLDGNGAVTIDEVVRVLHAALDGCP